MATLHLHHDATPTPTQAMMVATGYWPTRESAIKAALVAAKAERNATMRWTEGSDMGGEYGYIVPEGSVDQDWEPAFWITE